MIISSIKKDFYIKAAMHTKHQKMKELNDVESELIIANELIHKLKNEEGNTINYDQYSEQISQIRDLIKEKKLKLI